MDASPGPEALLSTKEPHCHVTAAGCLGLQLGAGMPGGAAVGFSPWCHRVWHCCELLKVNVAAE